MRRIKEKINNLSIWKKFILYTYIVLLPILAVICICVASFRYMTTKENYQQVQTSSLNSLAASLEIIRQDVNNFSLNLAINEQIQSILTSEEPERLNTDVKLWFHEAPAQYLEEIIALKGYIKTVSIYPENGVFAYLRCIDYKSYWSYFE